MFLGSS
jgi:hypothetical protein